MTNPLDTFVSINLCEQLVELGVTKNTWGEYRQYSPDRLELSAPGMDYLELYKAMEIPGVKDFIACPAYTLSDMLSLIPGYCISETNSQYEVCVPKTYQQEMTTDKRLPDAVAKMVIQGIRSRFLWVDIVNQVLLRNQTA